MNSAVRVVAWLALPATVIAPSVAQGPSPVLTYEMDVATTSGIGAGMSGMGAAMSMLGGGGDGVERAIFLTLSTAAQAAGAPRADHFFLPTVRLGKSVPLTGTGRPGPAEDQRYVPGTERPKGRILMFWGCGAKAGPGQPFILDAAKLVPAQLPPQLGGIIPAERTTGPARTIVTWPAFKKAPAGSSILGAHRIASNLGPEIAYTLAQDYMPALRANTTTMPDGSVALRWTGIAEATGYAASAVGGMDGMQRGGDVVFWTSAGTREGDSSNRGWLSPATVAGLIARRAVMPPSQTSCQMPAEFKRAAGEMMVTTLSAFGPEVNFAYPPRPPAPAPWKLEWTAKVRFRAGTTLMSGIEMGMGQADSGRGGEGEVDCKPKKKKGGFGGMLGGALGGALGAGSRDGC